MALYEILEDGTPRKIAGNAGSGLPVGAIFASAIPLTDARVHLLDGSTISQTGVYADFANLIKSLVAEGHNITYPSDIEFYSDVSTYGQCGKFVIDDPNGTIRLPLIKEFVASNNGGQEIGLAELDMFKSHKHDITSTPNQNYNGSTTYQGTSNWGGIQATGSASGNAAFFAAHTGGSETRPKNIRYPYYIVLVAGYKSDQVINIDNIATELNGKQDKLTAQAVALNTTRTGQNDTVVEYYMSSDGNTWYRKWASGWKECGGKIAKGLSGRHKVTFPLSFSNTRFTLLKTLNWLYDENVIIRSYFGFQDITTNSAYTYSYTPDGYDESWYACGF